MGMMNTPDEETMDEVFSELDEDGSNDISIEEMKVYLRKIFVSQRNELAKLVQSKENKLIWTYDKPIVNES